MIKSNEKILVRKEVLKDLKTNQQVKSRLAYEFGCNVRTIERWIEDSHLMLTTAMGVRAIAEELGIPKSEVLTK